MSAPRRLAFIVGINRYENDIPALSSAVRDAQEVADVLGRKHGYTVERFLDEDAKIENLRALFNGLPDKVGEDDRAVIYFAGHGIAESGDADTDGPHGYFIPQSAVRGDSATYLPMTEVQRALDRLKCKHLLVLLDCCFAGAFKWSKTRAVAGRPTQKLTKERYARYLRDPARQIITSASSNEKAADVAGKVFGARDDEDGHSPFALALINALKSAVADVGVGKKKGDGVTTATELHFYIEGQMAEAERKSGRKVQKPLLWAIDDRGHGGEFIFETPGQQPDLPSALKLSEENNPYRGLESYDAKHAAMFFGREKLMEQLAGKVATQSLTLVVGASRSGKSSLVRAGLVRQLTQAPKRWAVLPPVQPGASPMRGLEAAALAITALSAGGIEAPPHATAEPLTLAEAMRRLELRDPALSVLLIVDQLEELVTLAPGDDARTTFFAALNEARAAKLRVLCTLRTDFEPRFPELAGDAPGARFLLRSMNRDELRAVIEGPAGEHSLEFEPPTLVGELVEEMHGSPGALPLLSSTLSELYRERIKRDATDRALTRIDYDRLGGVMGTLRARLNVIFDGQSDAAAKATLGRVLLRLVSLKGGKVIKRRAPKHELVSADAAETARAETIVAELAMARLVVEGRENEESPPGGGDDARLYVEAAHDRLLTDWTRLPEILDACREDLPLLRACTEAAEKWKKAEPAGHLLWNDEPRLPQLQKLLKDNPLRFSALEAQFVERSGSRWRNQRIAIGVIVLVIIAGLSMATLYARIQEALAKSAQRDATTSAALARTEAARATSAEEIAQLARQRALLSRLVAEAGRPDSAVTQEQALLLSVEAERRRASMRLAPLPIDTDLRAVQDRTASTSRILRYGTNLRVTGLAWAPASVGHRVIAASGEGPSVVLWSADTGAELSRLVLPDIVDQVSWRPGAEQLVAHTSWWHQWVVAGTAGDALKEQDSGTFNSKIQSVEWSPDGKLALVVGAGAAVVWSADQKAADAVPIEVSGIEIAGGHLLPGGKEVLLCGRSAAKLGYAAIHAVRSSTRRPFEAPPEKPVRVLVNDGAPIDHCAVSPDGKWFATSTIDGPDIWSSAKAPPRHLLGGQVGALGFDHKSAYLAAGTTQGTAELWNVRKEAVDDRSRLEGHTAGLVSLQWSDDDNQLLTSSSDGTAILWDTVYSTRIAVLSGHDGPLTSAAWDPTDATRVATSSEDGTVRIFKIGQRDPPTFENVVDATYAPSGRFVAVADKRGVVTLRAAETGEEVRRFGGVSDKIVTVRYCPDGATLVTRDAALEVKLWAADTGALMQILSGTADRESTPTCSHDGRFIAAFDGRDAIVWDARSGARTTTSDHDGNIVDPVWHPSRNVAAQQVWAFSSQVRLLGPEIGAVPRPLQGNVDGVYAVAWSHDGARLVSGDNGNDTKGDVANGVIHLYDDVLEPVGTDDHRPTLSIAQPGNLKTFSLSWSPDDAFLVTGGTDAGRVWDTKTWTLRSTLDFRALEQVAWTPSPRSDRIATVDEHGVLRLFEPSTGELVAAPSFEGRTVTKATWNRDGSRLLVLLSDATARVITVYPEELQRQLCERAIRNFTREEWKRYLGDGPDEPYRATCENLPIEPEPAGDAGAP
jgi:WD40 repeat protein